MKDTYKYDNLLHQDMCQNTSKNKFSKDLEFVQNRLFDPDGKLYAMNNIIMIDDSPEKFHQFQNHVVICRTFSYTDKQAETLCQEQMRFVTKLVGKISARSDSKVSALDCLDKTLEGFPNNKYVCGCEKSQTDSPSSKSHGITNTK